MRISKKWYAAAAAILVIAAVVLAVIGFTDGGGRRRNMDLYFFNEQQTSITAEKREIKYITADELPYEVVQALIKGPSNNKLGKVMSSNVKVNSIEHIRGDVVVDFSEEFVSGESARDILAAYAVIKSLCGIPSVDRVKVSVGGEMISTPTGDKLSFLSSQDIKLGNEVSSNELRTVTLYFAGQDLSGLIAEKREIRITDDQPIEQYIVNELIKGPTYANLSAVLSADTQVISVQTKDGICFVNLRANFLDRNSGGSTKENLAVYSIVNSLTSLDNVKAVQFLIDGKKVDTFGQFGFSEPFERNTAIISEENEQE